MEPKQTELCHRESDGISVSLFYDFGVKQASVELTDTRTELHAIFSVASANALDAYSHPFAYLDSVKVTR